MDEQQRGRIRDDLQGFFKGELLFDELSRALYSTDASIFQLKPLGVAMPRDEEDVQGLVRYAAENRIPLIARGAGTGVAGESLGRGLIVDLSRHFREISEVKSDTVRVQPGVIYQALDERLAKEGRRFAPDTASASMCTIGGMLATNASGSHALRYGYTRDHVDKLRIVLDSGDAVWAADEPVQPAAEASLGHFQDIVQALGYLLEENAEKIQTCRPRTPFNRCGYLLHDVLANGRINFPRLLVGSEGTLALFTGAILRTIPIPAGRAIVLVGFESLDAALQAVRRALTTAPAACELLDRRLLSLARGKDVGHIAALIPNAVEAVVLVEYQGDSTEAVGAAAASFAQTVRQDIPGTIHVALASEPEEVARLWGVREIALPSLYGLKGGAQPLPFVEDVGVPPDVLGEYLRRVQEILREQEITASFLVHAGAGQVHTRPFLNLQNAEHVAKLADLAEQIHSVALELGGTVSTQHGTGLARTPWVARQYGALYPVFRQLKSIFDPKGIFNPGKIVDPEPRAAAWPLRLQPAVNADANRWLLRWEPGQVQAESLHCNGCGQCRLETAPQRMCPIFRATHDEAATPRAKANLLRYLLEQGTNGRDLAAEDVRAVADLCVNCKMCAMECPAKVNIPKLMLEAKAAHVRQHGLDRTDWFLARMEGFARWGSWLSAIVNFFLASRTSRWLLERTFGLSKRRRLPSFAPRSFHRRARQRGWTEKPNGSRPSVTYFTDVFANYNDPLIAEAVVAVLRHNGFDVHVPAGQRGCGMAPLVQGDVTTAREIAQHNVRVLAEAARQGTTILCSEPTAALMLRQDYLDLLDDADATLVANHVVEFTTFLWKLHLEGKLRTDFQAIPVSIGHHVPCHLKAISDFPAAPRLLSLIPGLRVHTIDVSCSGMAGTYGFKEANYATSLAAGRPMLDELNRPKVLFGSTECSACRLQMEDGSGKRTLHPAQYLALAYGLMPEIAERLAEPIPELVLR